jgi:hypothetical protein
VSPVAGKLEGSVEMPSFDRHIIQSIVAEGGSVSEAIAPGLRWQFADVVTEPLPAPLAALIRKLDAEPDEGLREDGEHGPSTIQAADRIGRGGRR